MWVCLQQPVVEGENFDINEVEDIVPNDGTAYVRIGEVGATLTAYEKEN